MDEKRKDREDKKDYVKPELKEFGSIQELTAATVATGTKNDMSGGPQKT